MPVTFNSVQRDPRKVKCVSRIRSVSAAVRCQIDSLFPLWTNPSEGRWWPLQFSSSSRAAAPSMSTVLIDVASRSGVRPFEDSANRYAVFCPASSLPAASSTYPLLSSARPATRASVIAQRNVKGTIQRKTVRVPKSICQEDVPPPNSRQFSASHDIDCRP